MIKICFTSIVFIIRSLNLIYINCHFRQPNYRYHSRHLLDNVMCLAQQTIPEDVIVAKCQTAERGRC